MSRPLAVACAATVLLSGCARYHEVAYVTTPVDSVVGVPVTETDLFWTHYRDRLAELPPLTLGSY